MFFNNELFIAKNENPVYLLNRMANRHGCITGATGTGKTTSVKVLAESFSDAGVPVFLSDIKGDLTGLSQPGVDSADMQERIAKFGLAEAGFMYKAYPTTYWDVFGKKGIPVRATISEMGPLLLSRLMNLSEAQEGILNIIFKIADDQGLLLLDLKDLRAVVQAVGDHASDYKTSYGNITTASIGAIQRGLLSLESQGADSFFGEPALDIMDWLRCDFNGRGMINVLNCEELFQRPALYAAFLLWMLSELYERLPEVGDVEKPKIVFFFDEAHLLFDLDSKELMNKVEQVVRLIRSKGVGVFFITQNPADIPDAVLGQLGNKIQHALRAYTPSDQKAVRAAAQSFAVNPAFKTEEVIPQLEKGEALVSFLDANGAPSMVQRANILPPQSFMGILDTNALSQLIQTNDMYGKYIQPVDRQSAYEMLNMNVAPGNAAPVQQAGAAFNPYQTQQYANIQPAAQVQQPAGTTPQQQIYAQPVQQAQVYNAAPVQQAAGAPSLVASVMAEQGAASASPDDVVLTKAQLELLQKEAVKQAKEELKAEQKSEKAAKKSESSLEKAAKSIATSAGRTAANYLVRGILGNLLKK